MSEAINFTTLETAPYFLPHADEVDEFEAPGRESNPLRRFARFQINLSSFPGLRLAQGQYCTPINTPACWHNPFNGKYHDEWKEGSGCRSRKRRLPLTIAAQRRSRLHPAGGTHRMTRRGT